MDNRTMKVLKVSQIIRMVEAIGWVLVRTKGDHRIYKKEGVAYLLSIPGKLSDDMPIGTQRALMKMAGLLENDK